MAYVLSNDTTIVAQNLSTASTSNSQGVSNLNGYAGAAVQITGTWTGTLIFEGSVDGGTTYFTTPAQAIGSTGAIVTTTTTNGQWWLNITGFSHFRVRCSVTGTGTAVVSIRATLGVAGVTIDTPIPAGTNIIGYTVGELAHDAADSGNPLKIGGVARSSEQAVVANADRVQAAFDLVGKQIILPYANPENFVSGAITTAMTSTTSTSLVAAPGSGLRNYITTIIVSNAHATVGTDVIIQDGSGGTTLLTIPAASAYGGAVVTLPTPLRQPTTNTALFCANVTTGASTKVSAIGYKGV